MQLDDVYNSDKDYRRLVRHMELVRIHWDTVHNVKELLANGQIEPARLVFGELPEDVRIGLWVATTKGGVWTVEERKMLKYGEQ